MGEKTGFIYGLYCECHPFQIRYVGKTVHSPRKRLLGHLQNARKGMNLPVSKWIRKHGEKNVKAAEIGVALFGDELNQLEIQRIQELGTHVSSGGLNVTKGGDGSLGFPQSPETIAKANASRAANRGPRKPKKRPPKMDPDERRLSILRSRARGEENGLSRLTEDEVSEIKTRLAQGEGTMRVARDYPHVTPATISHIKYNRAWAHVPWPGEVPVKTPEEIAWEHSPLTEDDVRFVRERRSEGFSYAKIAAMRPGVLNPTSVMRIATGQRWANIGR